ncbi:MAG TPA: hypothetical protein VFV70_01840 [Hyphomonadaceae bacterium]|nr:hypothetical protein [Hyphomonadaceae bacterium]
MDKRRPGPSEFYQKPNVLYVMRVGWCDVKAAWVEVGQPQVQSTAGW